MAKTLFLSDSEPEIIHKLKFLGYDVLTVKANGQLDTSIIAHADCALFSPEKSTYFVEKGNHENIVKHFTKGETQKKTAEDYRIIAVEGVKSPYPDDVKLNCKQFGKKILSNTDTVAAEIAEFAYNNGYKLIHCNQGYAACSTVKLNDSAAITDDESVYNTLTANRIDCIKVSKGSVKLKGFDYGFIGGCCGLTEKNKIVFTGNIEKHSDAELIKKFLIKYGIDYICLTDGELIDIGGIIPLYTI